MYKPIETKHFINLPEITIGYLHNITRYIDIEYF